MASIQAHCNQAPGGLASIVGFSAAVMMGMIAASEGHPHVALIAAVLAASLLGFLPYNLPPASVFLGDSGSMVVGLSLGLLGIQGSLKTTATLAVTAPAVVMTLPMFDVVAAVVRRKLTGRRLDAPDRLHIHHRLLDRGWTPWQVLCLIGAVCLTTGAAATAATAPTPASVCHSGRRRRRLIRMPAARRWAGLST